MTDYDVTLEDILDALVLEEPEPSFEALTRWSDRYPEHTDALAHFFAVWAQQADCGEEIAVDEDSIARRGVSYALDLLHRQDKENQGVPAARAPENDLRRHEAERNAGRASAQHFERLIQAAGAAGFSPQELARRTDLDESIIRKLDRRRIHGSIPRLCLERISQWINISVHAIRAMVTGPPILAVGARHKAKTKPAPVTESFADAIRHSSLPDAAQRFWLEAASAAEQEKDEPA